MTYILLGVFKIVNFNLRGSRSPIDMPAISTKSLRHSMSHGFVATHSEPHYEHMRVIMYMHRHKERVAVCFCSVRLSIQSALHNAHLSLKYRAHFNDDNSSVNLRFYIYYSLNEHTHNLADMKKLLLQSSSRKIIYEKMNNKFKFVVYCKVETWKI